MKIKLDASYEDARKVADCFVGCEFPSVFDVRHLVGIDDKHFGVSCHNGIRRFEQITLDLSTCQPNIYRCMEHGLKVEVCLVGDEYMPERSQDEFDFYALSDTDELLTLMRKGYEIKSIKILDLETMEGVKVV